MKKFNCNQVQLNIEKIIGIKNTYYIENSCHLCGSYFFA